MNALRSHPTTKSPLPAASRNPSYVAALFLIVVMCCGCQDGNDTLTAESSARDVTLALNWYAEAEHGGYVAAKELGYFDRRDLNVTVQQGGPGAPNLVIQELASGRLQFAISNADLVVLARAKGVDVVAVAAPLQQSPRCIMIHESLGIESLDQLADVQLAISDSRPFALWMKHKLPLNNVTMVPYSGQVGEFVLNKDFAQQAYVFSEPFLAKENGSDPQVLMLSGIGFDPYASLLVTTQETIDTNPNLVRDMVQASIEGWHSYLNDPQPVNARIHADNEDMSMASLTYGADAMTPLCSPEDDTPFCGMNVARWQTLIEQIEELGEIDVGSVQAEACFTMQFHAVSSE